MTLWPAKPDTGVIFRRSDLTPITDVQARYDHVVSTQLSTTLGYNGSVSIGTVEHLMAALLGCGIDNAVVELDGQEVPVMDGSAAPFVFLIECAGIVEQDAARRYLQICKEVTVGDERRHITLRPADHFSLTCDIAFDHRLIGQQSFVFDPRAVSFKRELSRARTFCFESDVEHMRAAGLALGGSLDNAIVIGPSRVLNEDGLRYEDEFVRHKALDCLGDLFLAGGPMLAEVHSVRAGHEMNQRLLRALFADPEAWRIVTLEEAEQDLGVGQTPALAASA